MQGYPSLPFYRVIGTLGEGFSARVFLAESLLDGQRRAVKVFKGGPDVRRHFLNELAILSRVTHPNIVTFLDFGKTFGSLQDYLVFEYIPGKDFVTASNQVSKHQFFDMIAQVCRALDFLHGHGFVHGDLKPQNIVVQLDGRSQFQSPKVKLCDLGCAGDLSRLPDHRPEGSANYLAPELVRGG